MLALVSLFHNLKVFQLKFHSLFSTHPSLVEVFHILFQMLCLLVLYLFCSMVHFLLHCYCLVNCDWIGYFHQLAAVKKFWQTAIQTKIGIYFYSFKTTALTQIKVSLFQISLEIESDIDIQLKFSRVKEIKS